MSIRIWRILVYLTGFVTLALSTFWLPWQVGETARINPALAYLQYPLLLCIYLTLFPFMYALHEADQLLVRAADTEDMTTYLDRSLKRIAGSILLVALIYVVACAILLGAGIPVPEEILQSLTHPLLGALVIFGILWLVRRRLRKKTVKETAHEMKKEA
jgi:hypothetical protein